MTAEMEKSASKSWYDIMEEEEERKVRDFQDRLEEERSARFAIEKEVRMLREELKHLNPSYDSSRDALQYRRKTKQELIGVISALNQKLQKATGELKLVDTLTEEKKALASKLQSRCKMYLENDIKWSGKMVALKKQLEESQDSNLELSSSLKRQEEENQRLQTEILELQGEKKPQILKADNLEKELEEVRRKYLEASNREQVLTETLSETDSLLRDSKIQLEEERQQHLEACRKDQKLLGSLKEKVEALAKKLQSRCKMDLENDRKWTGKVEALNKQLKQSQDSNLQLSSKLTSQEEDNQRLQEEVTELRKENQQMLTAESHEKHLQELSWRHLEQVEELEEERDSLKRELEVCKQEALNRERSEREANTGPFSSAGEDDAQAMVQTAEEKIPSRRELKMLTTPKSRRRFEQQRRRSKDQE